MHNMSAGKSASRPLLPVEETIRTRTLMNCEFRYHTFFNNITDVSTYIRHGRDGPCKFYYVPSREHPLTHQYQPTHTTWQQSRPSQAHLLGLYTFNVDWYMTAQNTVANVKKFVGEFH